MTTQEHRAEYGSLANDIIRYEDGSMEEPEAVEFFSRLYKSGVLAYLQGSYQRGFEALVKIGYLSPDGEILVEVVC